jgi:hypothetical protein
MAVAPPSQPDGRRVPLGTNAKDRRRPSICLKP